MKPMAVPPVPGAPVAEALVVPVVPLFELHADASRVPARAATSRARLVRIRSSGYGCVGWVGQPEVEISQDSSGRGCGLEDLFEALGRLVEPSPGKQHQHDDGDDVGDGIE